MGALLSRNHLVWGAAASSTQANGGVLSSLLSCPTQLVPSVAEPEVTIGSRVGSTGLISGCGGHKFNRAVSLTMQKGGYK